MPASDGASLPPPSGSPLPGPDVPEERSAPAARTPWWSRRVARLPLGLWILVAVAAIAGLVVGLSNSGGDDSSAGGGASSTSVLKIPTGASATPVGAVTTTVVVTTAPATTAPATTSAVTAPATTARATTTTAPPTTVPVTTAVATTPPTTVPETVATVPPTVEATSVPSDGRTVIIDARHEACTFGSNCLVAGFRLSGFRPLPHSFTCEFSNGGRFTYTIPAGRSEVKVACSTAKVPDSITIEVDGVRSETVTT